jgi:hypothetical protein
MCKRGVRGHKRAQEGARGRERARGRKSARGHKIESESERMNDRKSESVRE